jgi:hypothetical protein
MQEQMPELYHLPGEDVDLPVRPVLIEKNTPGFGWAILELWPGGTVRSPFDTREAAIERERLIAEDLFTPRFLVWLES